MIEYFNSRNFFKFYAIAFVFSLIFLFGILNVFSGEVRKPDVVVWTVPGGEYLKSPDYEVTISKRKKAWTAMTFYSSSKGVDKVIDFDKEGKYVKLGFRNLFSSEHLPSDQAKDTYANSWASFDFSEGPVEVEVKILRPFQGITLPLTSCGVFPSTLGIECKIVGDNIIRFTVEKPAMMAVVPNHLLAMEKLKDVNPKEVFEGYRNPLFLFARNPEKNIPSKKAKGTLVVKPGQMHDIEDFRKAKVIYFEAGIHDYSKFNSEDPIHYIELFKGQKLYLEGGAYLYAMFKSNVEGDWSNWPYVSGRGVVSGDRHVWVGRPVDNKMVTKVNLEGITATDPHTHFGGNGIVKDVAVVGAWHGNTDGINARSREPYDGWHIENCFCMAHDTNMGLGESTRVKNHTVWQLNNAEPLWIRSNQAGMMDGFNVIAYNRYKPRGEVFNFAVDYRRPEFIENVVTIRNAVVDAPFVPRIFTITSSSEKKEVIFKDVLFENIEVKTPHIRDKSRIGLVKKESSNFGKVVFRNIFINGVKLTENNFTDYFEILNGVTMGREIIVE